MSQSPRARVAPSEPDNPMTEHRWFRLRGLRKAVATPRFWWEVFAVGRGVLSRRERAMIALRYVRAVWKVGRKK
jgi:hypothetical protein